MNALEGRHEVVLPREGRVASIAYVELHAVRQSGRGGVRLCQLNRRRVQVIAIYVDLGVCLGDADA